MADSTLAADAEAAALALQGLWDSVLAWGERTLLTPAFAVQVGVLILIALVAFWAGRRLAPLITRMGAPHEDSAAQETAARLGPWTRQRLALLGPQIAPFTAFLLAWPAGAALQATGVGGGLVFIAAQLLTAWVVIRAILILIGPSVWTRAIAGVVWLATALAILGILEPTLAVLDSWALRLGETRLTALSLIYGIGLMVALIAAAAALVRLIEGQLAKAPGVTPSTRVLIGKGAWVFLLGLAVIIALNTVGIDFTALAVFTGALGVGIGFGLQKVISNLISGFILLLDRSIKPGDVIEIGDAYGWINKLGARYVAIVTRDGKEFLIPNEDLITQQVINWSYSSTAIRLHIRVGISYDSDVRRAMELMVEAARAVPRVLQAPGPQARLIEFGDSSVNLELRIWVQDPESGVVNVSSEVRLGIWDLFHAHGIKFPFPQRDVHIVSAEGLGGAEAPAGHSKPRAPAPDAS